MEYWIIHTIPTHEKVIPRPRMNGGKLPRQSEQKN
jgi:hypothetical protein